MPTNPVGAFVVGAIGAYICCLTTFPLALAGVAGLLIHGVLTFAIIVAGPFLAARSEAANRPLLYGGATGAALWMTTLVVTALTWDTFE